VYELPGYVWALVLAGVIGIPAATCAVLYRGAVAAFVLSPASAHFSERVGPAPVIAGALTLGPRASRCLPPWG